MTGTILQPGQIEAAANIPPFLKLPAADAFTRRGARLHRLAEGHALGDYLNLIAGLCQAQQRVADKLAPLPLPDEQQLARSREHQMPPLGYENLVREGRWLAVLDALLAELDEPANAAVGAALEHLRQADAGQRKAWALGLLNGQYSLLPAALVPFLGAALQVAFSHWLLALPEGLLHETQEQNHCPACGSPPVGGVIHSRGQYNTLRYLTCSLCACQWHYVRVKCSHCRESKGLFNLALDSDAQSAEHAPLRAEVCPACQGYLKQYYLERDEYADAQADDLASLALDIRLAEDGYLRRSPNLLLAPGGDD
ncbi:MAG: Protein FdhE [Stenotrophomonas maltophilia]|nr:MAG: Protein FdhE [Stenotrophomonas maltophilia]